MKWLKSSTQKSWVASAKGKQIVIPQNETSDNRWLQLDEDEFIEVSKLPVIASLIKAGNILVLDQEPAELRNSVPALQVTNTHLTAELEMAKARIIELEAQLKDASHIDIEQVKADAIATVKAECEQALAQKQGEYDALKAEAEQALADRDAKIAKLEKKIKKLGGEGEE